MWIAQKRRVDYGDWRANEFYCKSNAAVQFACMTSYIYIQYAINIEK